MADGISNFTKLAQAGVLVPKYMVISITVGADHDFVAPVACKVVAAQWGGYPGAGGNGVMDIKKIAVDAAYGVGPSIFTATASQANAGTADNWQTVAGSIDAAIATLAVGEGLIATVTGGATTTGVWTLLLEVL